MTQSTIQVQIPFDSLLNAIASLTLEDKIQILHIIETEIAQLEEDELENDPTVLAEIQESRMAYQSGDYQTLEQLMDSRKNKTR